MAAVADPSWIEIARGLGAEAGEAYFVGGCVRELLRGEATKDIDLALAGDPFAAGRALARACGGSAFWLHQEEQVVRVVLRAGERRPEPLQVDLSALRGTLEEDLRARDLTINALAVPVAAAADPLPALLDPTGGRADLDAGLIRFVSPRAPEQDPLRVLRALRFRWKLGFRIDSATRERIGACAPLLARVSVERIRDELFQLLALPDPAPALEECFALGLGRWLTGAEPDPQREPEAVARVGALVALTREPSGDLARLLAAETTASRRRRELLLWAGVLEGLGAPASANRHLALSSAEQQILTKARATVPRAAELARSPAAPGRARLRFRQAAGPAAPEAVLLAAARDGATEAGAALLAETLARHFRPEEPLLSGSEIMSGLGLQPGPAVGRALQAVAEARADGLVRTKEEALAWLRDHPPA